jgi:hypothetical protein
MVCYRFVAAQVTSLKRLLDMDVGVHIARIAEISDAASREWSIEKALDKMAADWEGVAFELGPWKETGGAPGGVERVGGGGGVSRAREVLARGGRSMRWAAACAEPCSRRWHARAGSGRRAAWVTPVSLFARRACAGTDTLTPSRPHTLTPSRRHVHPQGRACGRGPGPAGRPHRQVPGAAHTYLPF